MTDDLSQCGNCIYHYTYNGRDMCKQVGDDFYLQWKVENCPYHTSITKVAAISDEIYRLKAENAALRERLEKAVELPCKVGDKLFYVNEYYKIPKIEEHTVTAFTLLSECTQIHVESGGYFLTDTKNVCFDRAEAEARLAELKGEKK